MKPMGAKTYAKDGNVTKDQIIFYEYQDKICFQPVIYGLRGPW